MDLTFLLDWVEESQLAALFGLLTGVVFGVAAQRSSFCLRAATVEFARGSLGAKGVGLVADVFDSGDLGAGRTGAGPVPGR